MHVDIGVDLAATRLAAVVTIGQAFHIERRTMPKDPVDRCVAAQKWIERIIMEHAALHPVYVYVENPVLGRGGAAGTLPVAMIQGAVFAGAARAGATLVIGVNNTAWKKKIVGSGNASKPDIVTHVKKTWPRLYVEAKGNQDVCDAACIVLYGHTIRAMKMRVAAIKAKRARGGA